MVTVPVVFVFVLAWLALAFTVLAVVVVHFERKRLRAQRRALRQRGYIGEVPAGGDRRW